MEFLFEYKGSKSPITCPVDELKTLIRQKLSSFGHANAKIDLSHSIGKADGFILQRYSNKWGTFIDVETIECLENGDRVTVIPNPMKATNVKGHGSEAECILSKVVTPTQAEAKSLSKYFPSTSSSSTPKRNFNPSEVAVISKKRRRCCRKERPSTVSVIMLDKFSPTIPKGKSRQLLASKGLIQSMKFTRLMSEQEVKNKIIRAFKVDDFVVLDCDSTGHNLIKCAEGVIDGEKVVNRKGALYLCKEFNPNDSDDTSDPELPHIEVTQKSRDYDYDMKDIFSRDSSSDFEDRATTRSSISWQKKKVVPVTISSSEDEKTPAKPAESIGVRRKIMEEQDKAYAESLAIDQRKEESKRLSNQVGKGTQLETRRIPSPDPEEVRSKVRQSWEKRGASRNGVKAQDIKAQDKESEAVAHLPWQETQKTEDVVGQALIKAVDTKRIQFMLDAINTHHGMAHVVSRVQLYDDCMELYRSQRNSIVEEFPFRISFEDEEAIDTGGVARDFFSAFWELVYVRDMDGGSTYVPTVHPHTDISHYSLLGTILSHGFMSCGFLPIRLSFPVVVYTLFGCSTRIPDRMIVDSFMDFVSTYESEILQKALQVPSKQGKFPPALQGPLVEILGGMGCREIPSPSKIEQLIIEVARYELTVKPLGAMYSLRAGVPTDYYAFWSNYSIEELFNLYKALCASPESVLKRLTTSAELDANQDRVYSYLKTFIGNLNNTDLRNFVRFVTGSSVMIDKAITVDFNTSSGFTRAPSTHTCNCVLHLPSTFVTYPEFEEEFLTILRSQVAWPMHCI